MASFINHSNQTVSSRTVEDIVVGYGYAIIAVVGILGNSLVLIAVASSKALQTASTVFIVNLAVTDFLTCLTLPWFVVATFIDYKPYWDTICFVTLAIAHTTVGCSVYTLASIAINRFVFILSPRKYYRRIFQAKVLVVWVSFLWIWTILIAVFPPAVLDIGKLSYDVTTYNCRPITSVASSALYDQLLIYIYFPVPLLVICLSYTGIYVKVVRHKRRIKQIIFTQSSSTGRINRDSYQREMKVTRNMFYIFCAFLVCLLPHSFCNVSACRIGSFTRIIVSMNSVINPIIYGISHPHFRKVYKDIVKLNCPFL